ncbi:hypothetical protein, partial [Maribacter sp. ACAM166]|uniref:hypothetical protein n=1 Tax=Maribacter sp. ACAM166 TaxID=2508996 RepID=UPI0014851B97
DNTDDQTITTFSLDDTTDVLTLTLEDGGTQTVDFTTVLAAAGTDDQGLSLAAGNILTLEDGGTVNLTSFLDNTDDQIATEVSIADAAGNFTSIEVEGALAELAVGSTDDQGLSLATGNILTLEDGGTVNLSTFLDNTDDQTITTFSLDDTTDVLTLTLEDGGTQTVDFTTVLAAAGTDDQTATEVSIADAAGNFTSIEVEGALAELAASNTADDDTNALNEIQTIASVDGSVIVTPSGINYDLSVVAADGSETVVTAGTDISVTGDGSLTTPYVIANVRPDIFYPPSIAVDVSTTGTGRTIDLHAEYLDQYGTPDVVSAGAPAAIPTYANNELYYYVTYFDSSVFANVSVDANGEMTYDVIARPYDYNTLINVVFVAK